MILKRFSLPVLSVICLSMAPAIYSDPAISTVVTGQYTTNIFAPLQLSMLSQTLDGLHAGESRTDSASSSETFRGIVQRPEPSNGSTGSSVEKAIATEAAVPAVNENLPENSLSDEELAALRAVFLQAEKAAKRGHSRTYFRLAGQLTDYPLYPYLQYQWLSKHLGDNKRITTFLDEYGDTRYAALLKRKWLLHLARKRQWQDYLDAYDGSSSASLQCYYRRAQYNTGAGSALRDTALQGARDLWVVGHSQPKACDPLFKALKKSEYFTTELVWQRFDAAMRNNKTRLAGYIKKDLPLAERKTADLWLKLHRDPAKYIPRLLKQPQAEHAGQMFSHAVDRYAGRDIYQATAVWDSNRRLFAISLEDESRIERRLALKLGYRNDAGAYERLGRLTLSDTRSKTLRIRLALQEQNWSRVIEAIEGLDESERLSEKWQYWLARAYQETGRPLQADELFSELSGKRDFYGYLAAEILDRPYQLANAPLNVSAQDVDAVASRPAFRLARELKALEREREAKLQWWHALKQLDREQVPAAAKLAQQWQWDEIAIFSIAKVEYWDDVELRFPRSYANEIYENAEKNDLDPVILFGLIRRESAFNNDAHSPVGARGLMQLMPKTARQVARELKHRWRGSNSLYDPEKNLAYGAYYYRKLLSQFDGHYALALAAYNAGPNRVKKWLPEESMPADIWIETIPFRETREYVTTVLVYAMIYQQLLDSSSQLSMNELTQQILPLNKVAAAF